MKVVGKFQALFDEFNATNPEVNEPEDLLS